MTYFAYVERQKQFIRDRRGELPARSAAAVAETKVRACAKEIAPRLAAEAMTAGDFERLSRRLFEEIAEMRGLNRRERAAFC